MPGSEERFAFLPPSTQEDLRFKRALATDFSKAKPICVEEYLVKGNSGITKLNAFNQNYHPKYDQVHRKSAIAHFDKVTSR